jgi:putative tryptophan/tyrosine transport system substrate-binding protein
MKFDRFKRREFIALLGGSAASWSVATLAQPSKLLTIGYMGGSTPAATSSWMAAFMQRLRELGWIEGSNIAIVDRWAEGRPDRNAEIAADFVKLNVNVILAHGTGETTAAKKATATIPIVFAMAGDPVGSGLVSSLSRPGGNVTGMSVQAPDVGSKRLEFFREAVPGLRRLAIMANANNSSTTLEMGEVAATARKLGFSEVVTFGIRRADDIALAFEAFKGRADALYIAADPLVLTNVVQINTLALREGLPTIYISKDYLQGGGLMSYGSNYSDQYRRAAGYVDKILRGMRPSDIPVEQPIRFELVINLRTAKALNLNIPGNLQALADEVIE